MSEPRPSATAAVVPDDVTPIKPVIPAPRGSLVESTVPGGDRSAIRQEAADDLGMAYPGVRYAMECLGLRSR